MLAFNNCKTCVISLVACFTQWPQSADTQKNELCQFNTIVENSTIPMTDNRMQWLSLYHRCMTFMHKLPIMYSRGQIQVTIVVDVMYFMNKYFLVVRCFYLISWLEKDTRIGRPVCNIEELLQDVIKRPTFHGYCCLHFISWTNMSFL